ncbi:G-type lectin S-receptor-like serine/threonine-protein kinase [Thalictrum thalictroides]|uniref:G-type lectin S-receptor-like serine/threonine-protein kinase n=1 Tax=Thalictrum thalictroides TaxID=46969 RepID=A0A7J6XFP2_THATH|nr:G-type lectin S-receptor-like serine/threonine-protein kinase [Thalictrum thalictroides]
MSYVKNENENYFTYNLYDSSITSRIVMDLSGQIKQLTWAEKPQTWPLLWSEPKTQCEVSGFCGAFGLCDQRRLPFCRCLNGFQPQSPNDWKRGDYSGGCRRKTYLQCGDAVRFLQDSQQYGIINQQLNDTFKTAEDCKQSCLDDCSCNAYAFNSSCLLWKTDVFALQPFGDDEVNYSIYLRVAASEITSGKNFEIYGGLIN